MATGRALVLNAAGSWSAYQVGALHHLVQEKGLTFSLFAGTGMGAINAALAAAGELDALENWWREINLKRLASPNLRGPWKRGLFLAASQRSFLAAHASEDRLRSLGTRLMVSALDLQTVKEQVLLYPGGEIPLLDALTASIATPGLYPPLHRGNRQLVTGATANNFLLPRMLSLPIEEIFVVAAIIPCNGVRRKYTTMLSALHRNLAMNQAHDIRHGLSHAAQMRQAYTAFRHVAANIPQLADRIIDPRARERLGARLADIYSGNPSPAHDGGPPTVAAITPSDELTFPMWRFRRADIASAIDMGYQDARLAMEGR